MDRFSDARWFVMQAFEKRAREPTFSDRNGAEIQIPAHSLGTFQCLC